MLRIGLRPVPAPFTSPYLPNNGSLCAAGVMVLTDVNRVASSGVSSASAASPGEDSIPEASENWSSLKGLRGVVKEGLRN